MSLMWNVGIHHTQTGQLELPVQVSSGNWDTRITGRGRGQHTIPLMGAGIPRSLIREISKGNKYTLAQTWGNHVAYAGVITRRRYVKKTQSLVVESAELRSAYMNDRMLFGVPSYGGASTLLQVTNKSHAGAARAVTALATSYDSKWEFPIDLPADGSGSFSAKWTFDERMKWEDHLAQIEADGCEIDFHPYLDSDGKLRWQNRVAAQITSGIESDLAIGAPGSRVIDPQIVDDAARQMTGVLAFGKGGSSAPTKFSPVAGGTYDVGIRDIMMNFPDIDNLVKLQAAADTAWLELHEPTTQWSFGLHIWGVGPEMGSPGSMLNLWSYGDPFIEDGKHRVRSVALSGDMGFQVTPEVQYAA